MHFSGGPPIHGSTGPADPLVVSAVAIVGTVALLLLSVLRHFRFRELTKLERKRLMDVRRRRLRALGGRALRVRLVDAAAFDLNRRVWVLDEQSKRYSLEVGKRLEGTPPKDLSRAFWLIAVPGVEPQQPDPYRGRDGVEVPVLRAIDGVYQVGSGETPPALVGALPRLPRYLPIYPVVPLALVWLWSRSLGTAGREVLGYLSFLGFALLEPAAWALVRSWFPRSDPVEKSP
jgi:hypothetical protein